MQSKTTFAFTKEHFSVPSKISGNPREVGVDEFFDDECDLALEDGVKELDDEDEAHAQDEECDDQDDDSRRCVTQVPLREQRLTCKPRVHLLFAPNSYHNLRHNFDLQLGLEFDWNQQAALDPGDGLLIDFNTFRNPWCRILLTECRVMFVRGKR